MEEGLLTRNAECDKYMEERFGKPVWGEASITKPDWEGNRILITPMPVPGLWRLDKIRKGEINL